MRPPGALKDGYRKKASCSFALVQRNVGKLQLRLLLLREIKVNNIFHI